MSPLSPIPALLAVLLALGCAKLFVRLDSGSDPAGHFTAIDGLRGYLAFFVYLHHSTYWYYIVNGPAWASSDDCGTVGLRSFSTIVDPRHGAFGAHLYIQFGQCSVMLFFMITAFLFGSKVADGFAQPIDWRRLYVSRLARLTPLYLLLMAILFSMVAWDSSFKLGEPLSDLARAAASWLGFGIFGSPALNHDHVDPICFGGVVWSLAYEWGFYVALPLLALLLGQRPALHWWLGSALALLLILSRTDLRAYPTFAGGLLGVVASRIPRVRTWAASRAAAALVAAALGAMVYWCSTGSGHLPLLFMIAAFVPIACGNSLFGALTLPAARALGQISYSVYLLHSGFLYLVLHRTISREFEQGLSAIQYWGLILACVPALILICSLSYRYIEAPGMELGRRLGRRIRAITTVGAT